jgi:hypothetical protein
MDEKGKKARPRAFVARWVARAILILWAAFWLYFNIGSTFYWYGEEGLKGIVVHLAMVAIILVLFATAWFLELLGGILLIVLAGLTFYQWGWHRPMVALTLCLPPFIVGVMLISCWFLSRFNRKAHTDTDNQ